MSQFQKRPPKVFCRKAVLKKFALFTLESLLNRVAGLEAINFIKRDSG